MVQLPGLRRSVTASTMSARSPARGGDSSHEELAPLLVQRTAGDAADREQDRVDAGVQLVDQLLVRGSLDRPVPTVTTR